MAMRKATIAKEAIRQLNATSAVQQQFSDLLIGDFFDFISPDRMLNSFYKRCEKISARKYRDEDGVEHRIGSIAAKVYHVNS